MDVLVIGAGPAGLAISAALARRGVEVGCVSAVHPARWPNTYGIWEDELEGLGLDDCWECRWVDPVVMTGQNGRRVLDRVYLRMDNDKLQERLLEWCEQGEVEWLEGLGEALDHDGAGARLVDGNGNEFRAEVVIDATGHRPQFVDRQVGQPLAYQAAYGLIGEFDGDPLGGDEMVLMDFRPDYRRVGQPEGAEPTFLYAMALSDERFFVEETSLVARPAATFDVLEDRLAARIRLRGTPVTSVEEVERVLIPMNQPLPVLDQRVIGFGAAASMVHPATGYQMGRMLRTAPHLAATIAEGLGTPGMSPADIAQRAWQTIWPERERRARKLWLFGMHTIMELDARQSRQFFEVFFDLPDELWGGYMSGTLTAPEIAQAMWALFRRAPMSLRVALGRTALQKEGWEMVKALASAQRR